MVPLIDRIKIAIGQRGGEAERTIENVVMFGDLWWDRRPSLEEWDAITADPAVQVSSTTRYVAFEVVGGALRYFAAPLLIREPGFVGYRDGDGTGGPDEMGTFATLEDALEFERRYLAGEALDQIDVPRALAPHLVALRARKVEPSE